MGKKRTGTRKEDKIMKNILILIFLFSLFVIYAEEDTPAILLPKIDIEIEDIKKIETELTTEDLKLPNIEFETIPKPDFTEAIKIDLEKTLPQKIDSPEKQKPVDALITFGYGLNNYLFADFSIFIRHLNPKIPKIAIHYRREAKETLWFDKPNIKNSISLDDLKMEMIYSYKIFSLGIEAGYFANSYELQNKSIFNSLTKRIVNLDIGPSLKFNHQNDLTLRVLNSFLLTNLDGETNENIIKRNDFDYILQTDLVYTQIFGNNHYFTSHIGYDFNYLDTLTDGDNQTIEDASENLFFNNIKAGISYSTTIADSFNIKIATDFLGMFKETEFFWYILPVARFGYSFQDLFHCYVEGGGKLIEKPDIFWFKEHDYVIFPTSITPGYRWFFKTGFKISITGWFSANTDLEFAYNQNGHDWELLSESENLYTLKKASYTEINISTGVEFYIKKYLEIKVDWLHYFMEMKEFTARDNLLSTVKFLIPQIGLSFFVDFECRFFRFDINNDELNNIYLMNAGIDWNWQNRIGLGTKFNNILYFQKHQIMPNYDEPGFDFLVYLKIGF